jgi:dTDP-4-dehydrorhamnose reductase
MKTPGDDSQPVLVLGSAGALGKEICAQCATNNIRTVQLDRSNFNTSAPVDQLVSNFEQFSPRAAINCIALTGLNECTLEKATALESNAVFPQKLVLVSERLNLPILHFSTDNVFACNRPNKPYVETDVPCPTTWYGITKLMGESRAAQIRCLDFYVVRLPMLYGPTNDNQIVAKLLKQVLMGKEITVSRDVYTTPLYTPEAAGFAMGWLQDLGSLNSVNHFTSDKQISLFEFISILAKATAPDGAARVKATLSSAFPSIEVKPLWGGLGARPHFMTSFDQSVARYAQWIRENYLGVSK